MPRFTSIVVLCSIASASCGSNHIDRSPLIHGNAIENIDNAESLIWYDSVLMGDARYFDFSSQQHGTSNKGATVPQTGFGGTIRDCTNETAICTHIGLPISFPSQPESKSWKIEQYFCTISQQETSGQVNCLDRSDVTDGQVMGFSFEFEEYCVKRFEMRVSSRNKLR